MYLHKNYANIFLIVTSFKKYATLFVSLINRYKIIIKVTDIKAIKPQC